jgi:hypothetical protein
VSGMLWSGRICLVRTRARYRAHTTIGDHIAGQSEIRQSCGSAVPSEEPRPMPNRISACLCRVPKRYSAFWDVAEPGGRAGPLRGAARSAALRRRIRGPPHEDPGQHDVSSRRACHDAADSSRTGIRQRRSGRATIGQYCPAREHNRTCRESRTGNKGSNKHDNRNRQAYPASRKSRGFANPRHS